MPADVSLSLAEGAATPVVPKAPSTVANSVVPLPASLGLVSETQNSDAIALRAAISVLRIQREQCQKDMQALERLKQDAVSRPEEFQRQLTSGAIGTGQGSMPLLGKAVGNVSHPRQSRRTAEKEGDEDEDMLSGTDSESDTASSKKDESEEEALPHAAPFEKIPLPQNIIRCPPINWAKYHVVGESLNKLHAEQVLRPTAGEPQYDEALRPPVTKVAAPLRPLADTVMEPMKTRRGGRR
ncbi:MAG: hypothetical protein M1825_006155 [Sarcosagium campestre]|nr:MAG: hypothetical protein M1825_006155 [Sarcosagium campestre]